jgi:hypothetical protein
LRSQIATSNIETENGSTKGGRRFTIDSLFIDETVAYHIGVSLKDVGKKCFGINLIEDIGIITDIRFIFVILCYVILCLRFALCPCFFSYEGSWNPMGRYNTRENIMITPFRWLSDSGTYSLNLDISDYNIEYFAKHGMLGNGYDWEKLAILYLEENTPETLKKISFDCEADMFSASSDSKKILKEFALSFHELCADRIVFEKMLKHIR